MPEIYALVPMRHHSQRVPEKNYRELAGKPLFHHILSTLEAVPELAGIYVDTDSPVIAAGIRTDFPQIKIINRPEDLCGDQVSMNRILTHDMAEIGGEFYLQTHSTNPLLKPKTISSAIHTFLEHLQTNDSLFSVTGIQTRLYDRDGQAINHNPQELIQTQDLPPVYEENSCIYLFSEENFRKHGHRIGSAPLMFEIDPNEAWDIDTELDFSIVEHLMRKNNESN